MDFKNLFKLFLFSKHFVVIFLLLFTQMIAVGFSQMLIKTNTYNDQQQMIYVLVAFLIAMVFGAIIKVYCFFHYGLHLKTHKEASLLKFVSTRWNDWIVTEVRAQVRVLLRLFLLIIPGLIEAIRLSLALPYVFLDSRMKDPHFDPIMESREKLPLKSKLLIPIFLFIAIIPALIFALTNSDKIIFETSESLLLGVLAALAQSIGLILSYAYIINIYILTSSENFSENAGKNINKGAS